MFILLVIPKQPQQQFSSLGETLNIEYLFHISGIQTVRTRHVIGTKDVNAARAQRIYQS